MVDRGADGFRVGLVAGWGVVQGRRDRALHIDHVVVAQAVQLGCGDARLDVRFDVIDDFRVQAAGDPHLFDFFGGLDDDAHVSGGSVHWAFKPELCLR